MKDKTILGIVSMICVTGLEIYAISQGMNGVVLTAVIGVLAGVGGIAFGRKTTPTTETVEPE